MRSETYHPVYKVVRVVEDRRVSALSLPLERPYTVQGENTGEGLFIYLAEDSALCFLHEMALMNDAVFELWACTAKSLYPLPRSTTQGYAHILETDIGTSQESQRYWKTTHERWMRFARKPSDDGFNWAYAHACIYEAPAQDVALCDWLRFDTRIAMLGVCPASKTDG